MTASGAPLRLGGLVISPRLVLAPMSGITDSAFRRLVRRASGRAVGLMVTEFASAEGLTRHDPGSFRRLRIRPEERPVAVQIFGADADRMARAAELAERAGADVIDVNCGCPAPQVVRRGAGCALMREPERLYRILVAVRRAVSVPVTVKMRSGWDEGCRNAPEIAALAEAAGAAMVTVHARTRGQLRSGEADWSVILRVRERVSIPVVASGDVTDPEEALRRERTFAPDALMIGRAAATNPWIFRQIEERRSGRVPAVPTAAERLGAIRAYGAFLEEDYEPAVAAARLRLLAARLTNGLRGAHEFRRRIQLARGPDGILGEIDAYARVLLGEGSPLGETIAA